MFDAIRKNVTLMANVDDIDSRYVKTYTSRMDEIKKMLKAVISGQHALKTELSSEISELRKEMRTEIGTLRHDMNDGFEGVNKRIDNLGSQLAYLEDDTPISS